MRLSFRAKVIIGIALIELAMFSLLILSDLKILVSSHRDMMHDTIETTTSSFKSSTTNAIAALDTATLDELTMRLVATPTVKYVLIEDPDDIALSLAEDKTGQAAQAKQPHADIEQATDGIYREKAQVISSDIHIGTIYIGYDVAKITETKIIARNKALRIAITGLVLSGIFSFVFGSILSRRLLILKRAAEWIASGDYNRKIMDKGYDEIAEVSRAFNTMINNLKKEHARVEQYQNELEQMNTQLEQRVLQRTEQLSEANDQLKDSITSLKQTQAQLLQSEKMASIGQLAAGVAHEINNPIGYINSNVGTMEHYVKSLFTVLDKYQEAEAYINDEAVREALAKLRDHADLDFLRTDMVNLVNESKEGLTRVKDIVRDLKDYSHHDRAELDTVDLHQGIDSTLNIANNEIKYKAKVVKEYGDIPMITCYASQLNQVFMNMIVNAAQAIESEQGIITIRTWTDKDYICVSISDNGQGIDPENLKTIFDPFFTTKPVGKGTGLGLSLSYNIIEKHDGRIEVHSTVGEGTEFKIWLPIKQQQAA